MSIFVCTSLISVHCYGYIEGSHQLCTHTHGNKHAHALYPQMLAQVGFLVSLLQVKSAVVLLVSHVHICSICQLSPGLPLGLLGHQSKWGYCYWLAFAVSLLETYSFSWSFSKKVVRGRWENVG